jgi:hypothetical protein
MSKRVEYTFVMCQLDKKTLLAATPTCFVLKERVKVKSSDDVNEQYTWVSKYYYSELGDALRGYVKHKLRKPETAKDLDGSILNLIKVIEKLETIVTVTGNRLVESWDKRMCDPVEAQMFPIGD